MGVVGVRHGAVAPGSCCPSDGTNVQDAESLSVAAIGSFIIIPRTLAVGETEARGS